MERTPNKSQHTKLTLEKKIFLPLPLGFKLATFQSKVWCSTNTLPTTLAHIMKHVSVKWDTYWHGETHWHILMELVCGTHAGTLNMLAHIMEHVTVEY